MAEIEDAIERAEREGFTREPPKTLQGRINFLMKQLKSAKAVVRICVGVSLGCTRVSLVAISAWPGM